MHAQLFATSYVDLVLELIELSASKSSQLTLNQGVQHSCLGKSDARIWDLISPTIRSHQESDSLAAPSTSTTQSTNNSNSFSTDNTSPSLKQECTPSEAHCDHDGCRMVFRGPHCENSLLRHDREEHQDRKFKCPIEGCSKTPSGRRHNIIDHLCKKHQLGREEAVTLVPRNITRAPNRQRR